MRYHPSYSSVTHVNDIALVRTDQDMEFSRAVGPVCLPFSDVSNNLVNERVMAVGKR